MCMDLTIVIKNNYTIQVKGWTGLILACRKGHLVIVKNLLDKGADVNMSTAVRHNRHTVDPR